MAQHYTLSGVAELERKRGRRVTPRFVYLAIRRLKEPRLRATKVAGVWWVDVEDWDEFLQAETLQALPKPAAERPPPPGRMERERSARAAAARERLRAMGLKF